MKLIDKDKLKTKIKYIVKSYGIGTFTKEKLLDAIDKCAIEDEPVRHGHWIPQYTSKRGLSDFFACSECNKTSFTYHKVKMCSYNFCPNCGAKMDLEESKND